MTGMSKRVGYAAIVAFTLATAADSAMADGFAEPLMEPEVIAEETAAAAVPGGVVIPLLLLALVAFAAMAGGGGSTPPVVVPPGPA